MKNEGFDQPAGMHVHMICVFVFHICIKEVVSCHESFLLPLPIAGCDIGVQLSVWLFVRPSVLSFVGLSTIHVHVLFSAAMIAGSMEPCIVIILDTLYSSSTHLDLYFTLH